MGDVRASPQPFPGLVEYQGRATRALIVGAVVTVVGLGLAAFSPQVSVMILTVSLIFGIGMGAVAYLRIDRIRRLAERDGWRRRSAHFRVAPGAGNGQPGLVLDADDVEAEAVLSLSTTVYRWGALYGSTELWVTGDPLSRFAAVATTDFGTVIVVKRPLLGPWRRRLRKIALAE